MEKIDGNLGSLIYKKGHDPFFQTSTGNLITNLPVLEEYKKILDSIKGINSIIIVGDLVGMKKGIILPFEETQSIVRTPNRESSKPYIHHYIYDVHRFQGNRPDFKTSLALINKIFNNNKYIHVAKHVYGDIEKFRTLYKEVVKEKKSGIDGVIVRTSEKNYKVKPFQSFDLAIIGFGKEGMISWEREEIGYIIAAFLDKDNIFRTTSKIGTGFDLLLRKELFKYANENKLFELKGEVFIKPEKIIEVRCLRYNFKKMPSYKITKNKIEEIGLNDSITLINPRLIRFRDDKNINKYDLRLEQIPDFNY